ncbi:MAG: hypothetical protein Q9166_007230 [cf. Caloplaca sp. 2 TL-2023]
MTAVTLGRPVAGSTLCKRSRDDDEHDDGLVGVNPSKRWMTSPPCTSRHSARGRPIDCEVDRLSPRHQIFGAKRSSTSPSRVAAKWEEDIEAFFNPSFFSENQFPKGSLSLTQSTSSFSSAGGRATITSLTSRSTSSISAGSRISKINPKLFQVQIEEFRRERRRASQDDMYRKWSNPHWFPKIGEDDGEYSILIPPRPSKSRESSVTSIGSRKRGAEEAFEEATLILTTSTTTTTTPDVMMVNAQPAPAKRQRIVSRSPSLPDLSKTKPSPTIKQLEKTEAQKKLSSPKNKRFRVMKPVPYKEEGPDALAPKGSWMHAWISGLSTSRRLQRKIEYGTEKMKRMKVEHLVVLPLRVSNS